LRIAFADHLALCRKQIESLMAKLNESKRSERTLKTSLEELEQKCGTWQEQAEEAEKAVKGSQALQNTIDHLENRLEISNIERLDAEEQLFNILTQKSPFDFSLPNLQDPTALKHEHTKVGHNASKYSQRLSAMRITMI
jgi:septal ring factor EnvC (AmiA/AmiB activator)